MAAKDKRRAGGEGRTNVQPHRDEQMRPAAMAETQSFKTTEHCLLMCVYTMPESTVSWKMLNIRIILLQEAESVNRSTSTKLEVFYLAFYARRWCMVSRSEKTQAALEMVPQNPGN